MNKTTAIKTAKDMEDLLNRMFARIVKLEEEVRLLDAEISALSEAMVVDNSVVN